jgi:hypothetical protein
VRRPHSGSARRANATASSLTCRLKLWHGGLERDPECGGLPPLVVIEGRISAWRKCDGIITDLPAEAVASKVIRSAAACRRSS